MSFVEEFDDMQAVAHANSAEKGFWDGAQNMGEKIALIHSEASEALEALRHGNPDSEKIAGFTQFEEELADIVIRAMDLAGGTSSRLAEAIEAKHAYNRRRPHKHGKAF